MKNKLRYAIVGGGAAGCTLGWTLTQNGHEVDIYERWKGLGGLAAGIPFGKTTLDRFYHHIFTSDTHIQAYIDRLGLQDKLHWLSSSVAFEHKGNLYPFTSPKHLLQFSPLSLVSRLRMGLAVVNMRRQNSYEAMEEITAEELIIRQMGEQAYRVVWEPLLRSKFGEQYYREVSAVWFWGKIKLRGGTRSKSGSGECLGYMKDGWGQIYEGMGEKIVAQGGRLRLGEIVRKITHLPSGKLQVRTRDSQDEYDRVIVTPSVPTFLELVSDLPEDYQKQVNRIPYQANITLALGLDRSLSPYYWLNVTDPESPFVAVIEHTNLFQDPDYDGLVPVYLSRYLSQDHPYYNMRMQEVCDLFLAHLQKLFPHFSRDSVKSMTFSKADYAQPVIGLHYSKIRPSFDTPIPGLYLCTMVQIYPEDRGMNYSIRLAEELLCHLGELNRLSA